MGIEIVRMHLHPDDEEEEGTDMQKSIKTFDDLYDYAVNNGLEATKELLKKYIDDGQPNSFMPKFTTRAMCRCAGMALDKIPKNEWRQFCYLDTKHGWVLFDYMWGL